jgi:hypothetical protein
MAMRLWRAVFLGMCCWWAGTAGEAPPPMYSPTERLKRERLAAAHASVVELAGRRRSLPPAKAGLTDFRCNFHAHAEDSAHTGGTRPEMLAAAMRVGVNGIFLSDHFRPPRDFMDSWRFKTNGVLFVPGSEARGFLISPMASVFGRMELPATELAKLVTAGDGLAFLSHIEERPDHCMEGLTGLEIYNRHYDAKRDLPGLLQLAMRLTDQREVAELEDLVRLYPAEMLAAQVRYADTYLDKWDAETKTRRLTGVGANDCHHNQVMIVKVVDEDNVLVGTIVDKDEQMRAVSSNLRPSIRRLTRGRKPGDIAVRLDFDPYHQALLCVCTHVFAPELTEAALRTAVKAGRVYVSHDWMADPTGFSFEDEFGKFMGDEFRFQLCRGLRARIPVPGMIRLLCSGEELARTTGTELRYLPTTPGVYRVEAWLEIGGEWRPWIYSNPIYLR